MQQRLMHLACYLFRIPFFVLRKRDVESSCTMVNFQLLCWALPAKSWRRTYREKSGCLPSWKRKCNHIWWQHRRIQVRIQLAKSNKDVHVSWRKKWPGNLCFPQWSSFPDRTRKLRSRKVPNTKKWKCKLCIPSIFNMSAFASVFGYHVKFICFEKQRNTLKIWESRSMSICWWSILLIKDKYL